MYVLYCWWVNRARKWGLHHLLLRFNTMSRLTVMGLKCLGLRLVSIINLLNRNYNLWFLLLCRVIGFDFRFRVSFRIVTTSEL